MLKDILTAIFRLTPNRVREWFSRATNASFMASAGAVVLDDQGRVLLLEHVFRTGCGWGIPGGFLAADEQPDEGLRRELREEVGLEVQDVEIAFVRTFSKPKQIQITFRCRAAGEAHARGIEVRSAAWFALDALPAELSENQRALIERALGNGANGRR
jgi:8-oxo-dGTP diphosphatase